MIMKCTRTVGRDPAPAAGTPTTTLDDAQRIRSEHPPVKPKSRINLAHPRALTSCEDLRIFAWCLPKADHP